MSRSREEEEKPKRHKRHASKRLGVKGKYRDFEVEEEPPQLEPWGLED